MSEWRSSLTGTSKTLNFHLESYNVSIRERQIRLNYYFILFLIYEYSLLLNDELEETLQEELQQLLLQRVSQNVVIDENEVSLQVHVHEKAEKQILLAI